LVAPAFRPVPARTPGEFMPAHRLVLAGVVAVWFAPVGCSDQPATAVVKGKVTYNAKPVSSGTIMFVPAGAGPAATGEIQPDGTYTLTTFKDGDGAVLGSHAVMVTAFEGRPDGLPEDKVFHAQELVPPKFSNTATSGLTAEVGKGENTINFDLTDEKTPPKK
jgi:hypothetical protein